MKFSADKQILLSALTTTSRATGKNVIPILEDILFDIQGDSLALTGSNLEVFITQKIEIKGSGFDKKICLPTSGIINLVKSLPDGMIEFTIEEIKLEKSVKINCLVQAGKGKYTVPAENGNDFPQFKGDTGGESLSIKADDLLKGISKTLFACGVDAMGRNNLTGINISIEKTGISYVATNTAVLSSIVIPTTLDVERTVLVSSRVMNLLQALPFDEAVNVSIGKNGISFQVNDETKVMARLLEEKYPDYKAIIPKDQPFLATLSKAEFLSVLKRVSNFVNSENPIVKFNISEDVFMISTEDDVKGKANETVAHDYKGEDLEIGFNVNLLMEGLKRIDAENVDLSFKSSSRAMVLKQKGEPEESLNLMLFMPMFLIPKA